MKQNGYTIRLERKEEHREVETLIREAFWNVYRPGCMEHYVIHQLRNDPAFVPQLDLVMEQDGRLIGVPIMRASFVRHCQSASSQLANRGRHFSIPVTAGIQTVLKNC